MSDALNLAFMSTRFRNCIVKELANKGKTRLLGTYLSFISFCKEVLNKSMINVSMETKTNLDFDLRLMLLSYTDFKQTT